MSLSSCSYDTKTKMIEYVKPILSHYNPQVMCCKTNQIWFWSPLQCWQSNLLIGTSLDNLLGCHDWPASTHQFLNGICTLVFA